MLGTPIATCEQRKGTVVGGLAHSVERSVRNRQAGGSKPPSSTSFAGSGTDSIRSGDRPKTTPVFMMIVIWWYSVVVSISGCDPLDPGSNPGTAITFLLFWLEPFFFF